MYRTAMAHPKQPFTFFVDADTGRGCVVYHRYDGHYGLLVPSGARR